MGKAIGSGFVRVGWNLWQPAIEERPDNVAAQLVCDEKTAGTGDVGAGLKPAPYKRSDYSVTSQLVCDVPIAVPIMAGTSPATTKNGVPFRVW
ncbi:hypothetical protein J7J55_00565, partial [Candidatus Bipolaricaulota bacterium]|nr:hypothetical protein [Candidatus Bipolaricaulota bacterium]